jgi:allophanate hydrolase subunit 1
LYPDRSMPASPAATYDRLHHECQIEQTRRAWSLAFRIEEHEAEVRDLIHDYEELADRYNDARAELAAWRAWGAACPVTRGDAPW